MKAYAIWNNKGGVGKTYLTFVMASEYAFDHPDQKVIVADMCPQANLSEIILGGNGIGSKNLGELIDSRKTIGGYFDERIKSPHTITGSETSYLIKSNDFNSQMPGNLFILAGDPSLEIQASVINQLSAVSLPQDSWKNVHLWLKDILVKNSNKLGDNSTIAFIDCNPSFAAYTELALLASDQIIIPCSSDGSSARAIDNIGQLVYGIDVHDLYKSVTFTEQAQKYRISVPIIHSLVFNRSTTYDKKASKAFGAMFENIARRAEDLRIKNPSIFSGIENHVIPDNHAVAIVSSHLGMPLRLITPGSYKVHDQKPQVNNEPLDRYKKAIVPLVATL